MELRMVKVANKRMNGGHAQVAKAALTGVALTMGMASHSVWAQSTGVQELPTVVVEGQKTAAQIGYKAEKTRVGKTKQELKDIPQAVTVVTEQLMKDKNADSLKEALRNVAGITFNAGEGGRIGDNINLRGYSAVGDLYLDNIRDYAQYNRETFNVQQIDVLKGASSMLFGRGSTGGVINQVSKTAQPVDSNEITITGGSNSYKRATADLNKAITDNVAFRLNAMDTKTTSERSGATSKRYGIAPTLTIGAGTQDEVNLSYYYLNENNVPDYGVPYVKGADGISRPLNVATSRFYGLSNADYERNQTGIATASYTHLFSNDSSIKMTVRDAHYSRDLRATAPRFADRNILDSAVTDSTVINRQRQARGAKEHQTAVQTDFNTKFETGRFKHEFLTGAEFVSERSNRWTNTNTSVANPSTTVGNTDSSPALSSAYYSGFSRTNPNSYKAQSYGLYVQDTVEVAPKWKVLAGLRYDHLKANYKRDALGDLNLDIGALSGRAGVLYQPNDASTYYASYSTGFNSTAEAYQLDDRLVNTDPEKTRNMEIGAKFNLYGGRLGLRTSLSRSEKTNERNTDLASPDVYLLSGKRHTDALEFEVTGRITPKWDVFFNHAFMRAKIDQAAGTAAGTLGMTPRNTPRYTSSIWTTYKLPRGFTVGGGVEFVGKRFANDTNATVVKGYTRVDAMAEYSVNKWLTVKLNVKNLFNRKYYEGVYTGHVLPGAGRTAEVSLVAKF